MNNKHWMIKLVMLGCILLAAACKPIFLGGGGEVKSGKPRQQAAPIPLNEQAAFAYENNAFAYDLYGALRGQDGNLFYSPYSISVALAMTYAGAQGDTASQMAQAMHFALPQEKLHPAFNALSLDLESRGNQKVEGTPFQLSIANSLWGQQDFSFKSDFLDLLAESYGAGMRTVDFARDPESARQVINGWVSDQTKEKIKDIIPPGSLDALTRLVLANAIYFKADWLNQFKTGNTQDAPFHKLDGSSVDVPFMNQSEGYGYALMDGYTAIDLPYAHGGVSMLVILPDEGQFDTVEQKLNNEMVDSIYANLQQGMVNLSLPKFKFDSFFNLNAALGKLGMTDAFDPQKADFSSMTGSRDLYIGQVLHKAFVAVDEEGTEAAAATVVIMEATAIRVDKPIEFKADRPFIFLIRDSQNGTILFVGRVLEPE